MQGIVLAGVELISAIFHYQYSGKKKKKEYQANGNQTKKNPDKRGVPKEGHTYIYNIYIAMDFFFPFFFLCRFW